MQTYSFLHSKCNELKTLFSIFKSIYIYIYIKTQVSQVPWHWHVSLFSDSSHSCLRWLHNPCHRKLNQGEASRAQGNMTQPHPLSSPVDLCWPYPVNVSQELTVHILYTSFRAFFFRVWQVGVRSSSLNGTDGEPHWPVSMGLQNIWRERLQEGHNCIKGTRL